MRTSVIADQTAEIKSTATPATVPPHPLTLRRPGRKHAHGAPLIGGQQHVFSIGARDGNVIPEEHRQGVKSTERGAQVSNYRIHIYLFYRSRDYATRHWDEIEISTPSGRDNAWKTIRRTPMEHEILPRRQQDHPPRVLHPWCIQAGTALKTHTAPTSPAPPAREAPLFAARAPRRRLLVHCHRPRPGCTAHRLRR